MQLNKYAINSFLNEYIHNYCFLNFNHPFYAGITNCLHWHHSLLWGVQTKKIAVTVLTIVVRIMINNVCGFADSLRRDSGHAEEVKSTRRGRQAEESRRSEAAFQPAVTLMTPFITMCRLTSWQRHAAPDGGEERSITPTLCLSFVEEEEEECGSVREEVCGAVEEMEERRKWRRPDAQLDWLLQKREWPRCPSSLCFWQAGGLNFGLTLSALGRKKTGISVGGCQFTWFQLKTVTIKMKKIKWHRGERSGESQRLVSYLLKKSRNLLCPCLNYR